MNTDIKPWDRLSPEQQKVALDLAAACSLIITRLPSISQDVFAMIERDYVAQYDVSTSIAKYALRACGRRLLENPWSFTITKNAENHVFTHFRDDSLPGGNGE